MSDRVCQDGCEAYRLFGTPGEIEVDSMEFELSEMSTGITAWRTIAHALESGTPFPPWVRSYLEHVASGIEDWAMLNGHPGELKDILHLHGKRKYQDDRRDPRYVFDAICQLRGHNPKASVKSLVQEFIRQDPKLGYGEEAIRQKYYEGKKLAETGQDYKGRDRKRDVQSAPMVSTSGDEEEASDF